MAQIWDWKVVWSHLECFLFVFVRQISVTCTEERERDKLGASASFCHSVCNTCDVDTAKNIASVRNCSDITILNSLFYFLSFCLFLSLSLSCIWTIWCANVQWVRDLSLTDWKLGSRKHLCNCLCHRLCHRLCYRLCHRLCHRRCHCFCHCLSKRICHRLCHCLRAWDLRLIDRKLESCRHITASLLR